MRIALFIGLIGFGFVGCKKMTQAEKEDLTIQNYIKDNGLTAVKTSSGLYVVIDEVGTGAACNVNSDVKVRYKGYFDNHDIFDQSTNAGITFNLQGVIKGWQEGIPYFKEEGHGKLIIPSALGYGSKGSGSVPGNTVMIFDVELLDVL